MVLVLPVLLFLFLLLLFLPLSERDPPRHWELLRKRCQSKGKLAPMFNMAAPSLKDVTSATQSPTQLTIQEILEPKAPNLRENQLSGTTAANVKKWTQNFNLEAQQMSKKIMDIIKAAKCTKEQLQQASTQYGLNLSDVLKLSTISLQQAVAVGAAVTA